MIRVLLRVFVVIYFPGRPTVEGSSGQANNNSVFSDVWEARKLKVRINLFAIFLGHDFSATLPVASLGRPITPGPSGGFILRANHLAR